MRALWKLIRSLFGHDDDPANPLRGPVRKADNAWDAVSARREGPTDSQPADPQLVRRRMNRMAAVLVTVVLLAGIVMWIADSVGTNSDSPAATGQAGVSNSEAHPVESQHCAVVAQDSAIYSLRHFPDKGTYLFAYDSRGRQLWRTRLPNEVRSTYNLQLAATQGVVLFFDRNHALAFDTKDGKQLWQKALPKLVTNYQQATMHQGVWITVLGKTLYAYDLKSGQELWRHPLHVSYLSADYRPLPVDDGIGIPDGDNGLTDMKWVVCNIRTGAQLRSLQPHTMIPGAPYKFTLWSTCRVYDLPEARKRVLMYGSIGNYSALQEFDWNLRSAGPLYILPTGTYQDFRGTFRGQLTMGERTYICPKTQSGSVGNQVLEIDVKGGKLRQLLVHEKTEHVPVGLFGDKRPFGPKDKIAVYEKNGGVTKVAMYSLSTGTRLWDYDLRGRDLAGWETVSSDAVDLVAAGHELMLWNPIGGTQNSLVILDATTGKSRVVAVDQPMKSIQRVWPVGRGWLVVPDTYPFLWRAGKLIPLSTKVE